MKGEDIIKKVVTTVAENAPYNVVQARKTHCMVCPQRRDTPGIGMTCGTFLKPVNGASCGCSIEAKTALAGSECPQRKWLAINR